GNSTAGTESQAFSYSIGTSTDINNGTFTANPSGNLTAGTTGANLSLSPTPNTASVNFTVTGISWAPGTNLSIRWADTNSGGNDDGYGIDDLPFSATVANSAPTITSRNNTPVTSGVTSTFQVTATGTPTPNSYSLTGAPAWVSIDNTGLITF